MIFKVQKKATSAKHAKSVTEREWDKDILEEYIKENPPLDADIQPSTGNPPPLSDIQPSTGNPPPLSDIQPSTGNPPLLHGIQPSTGNPPKLHGIQPSTGNPPLLSDFQSHFSSQLPAIQGTLYTPSRISHRLSESMQAYDFYTNPGT